MYEELVKALRETDFGDTCVLCEHEDMCKGNDCIIIQAADAIEELSAINERQLLEIAVLSKPRWIPVTERLPSDFVSVQAHMTDAGNFPPVREAYVVNKNWFFPALKEFHPVDMWKRFDEPPKEE